MGRHPLLPFKQLVWMSAKDIRGSLTFEKLSQSINKAFFLKRVTLSISIVKRWGSKSISSFSEIMRCANCVHHHRFRHYARPDFISTTLGFKWLSLISILNHFGGHFGQSREHDHPPRHVTIRYLRRHFPRLNSVLNTKIFTVPRRDTNHALWLAEI